MRFSLMSTGSSSKHRSNKNLPQSPNRVLVRCAWSKNVLIALLLTSAVIVIFDKLEFSSSCAEHASVAVESKSSRPNHVSEGNENRNAAKNNTHSPGIAWLMSFPNSGTSFTMSMIQRISLKTMATNYAKEVQHVLVHANSPNGPFWQNLTFMEDPRYQRPSAYVLTKTHCGGRCNQCGPSVYVETPHSFLTQCLSGSRVHVEGKTKEERVAYDSQLVSRAVHLIRNPFDNIVSRFHHARKIHPDKAEKYTGDREGFRAFCQDLNRKYKREEEESRFVDSKILEIVKDVPCHADFLRYVQWHNLAFTTTEELGLPTHILQYENYDSHYQQTMDELLRFLQLNQEGDNITFIKGKEYASFFELQEKEAVRDVLEKLSSRRTWKNIQHYFAWI